MYPGPCQTSIIDGFGAVRAPYENRFPDLIHSLRSHRGWIHRRSGAPRLCGRTSADLYLRNDKIMGRRCIERGELPAALRLAHLHAYPAWIFILRHSLVGRAPDILRSAARARDRTRSELGDR